MDYYYYDVSIWTKASNFKKIYIVRSVHELSEYMRMLKVAIEDDKAVMFDTVDMADGGMCEVKVIEKCDMIRKIAVARVGEEMEREIENRKLVR